jgi:hypothetical protein
MKNATLILLAVTLSLGLAACAQRVKPAAPEGKIIPSNSY